MPKLNRPGQLKRPKRPDEVLSKIAKGGCNYVACIGQTDARSSLMHNEAIAAEARRRGPPFVVWTPSMRVADVPKDAIIVVVLYGESKSLTPLFRAFPHLPRVTPLVMAYNAQGEGFASPGGDGDPKLVGDILDRVQRLVDGRDPLSKGEA